MNFLSCEWRKLAVANYAVDPNLLAEFVPAGTDLDLRHGKCYVSLVGFMFLNTRALGLRMPGLVDFEEVNLRFYVKRVEASGEVKRGVVFIREIVPKTMLAFVANSLYKERYKAMPMTHRWSETSDQLEVDYRWHDGRWNSMRVVSTNQAVGVEADSDACFILEHYWGYTKVSDSRTFEYRVEHQQWQIYPVTSFSIDVAFGDLYGAQFAFLEHAQPESVFLAEGSEVIVKSKRTLRF